MIAPEHPLKLVHKKLGMQDYLITNLDKIFSC